MTHILLVEDNPDLAFGLRNNLEIEGYDVTVAADGPTGLSEARQRALDLMILDLMLPGLDGFRVLRALREDGWETPVLVLTARGEEADKVRGLQLGADDYVTKPFGVLELLARVQALLRRATPPKGAAKGGHAPYRFGEVVVDCTTRTVARDGALVPLAPLEFDLLVALIRRDGAVVSREALLREVWGYRASVISRTVDTHVAELRRKLGHRADEPGYIATVSRAGYRLQL